MFQVLQDVQKRLYEEQRFAATACVGVGLLHRVPVERYQRINECLCGYHPCGHVLVDPPRGCLVYLQRTGYRGFHVFHIGDVQISVKNSILDKGQAE